MTEDRAEARQLKATVTLLLPYDLVRKIDERCEREKISRGKIITDLLEKAARKGVI